MSTDRALIRATLPFASEQPSRSWWYLISTTFLLASCMAIGAAPIPWWIRISAGMLGGLLLCRLFIIYHDQQHGAIFRGSRLANWLMTAFGVLTLNPPSTWTSSHNYHHKHNGKILTASIGSFPVMTVESYARSGPRRRFIYRMSRHPLTILSAWITVFLIGMTCVSLVRNPRKHLDCAAALGIHTALWILLLLYAPSALFFSFVVPLSIGAAMGAYLFYAQHNFPGVDFGDQAMWDYVFSAMRSSSFLDTNPVMHWFTGNIGYHHIHHLNPRIPFYRLPEVMKALPALQSPGRTCLSPMAIYRCCGLKLWDSQRRLMVGFSAA